RNFYVMHGMSTPGQVLAKYLRATTRVMTGEKRFFMLKVNIWSCHRVGANGRGCRCTPVRGLQYVPRERWPAAKLSQRQTGLSTPQHSDMVLLQTPRRTKEMNVREMRGRG